MSIRLPVLLSTLEHVQLEFEVTKKFIAASIKLDTANLTRDEIIVLRQVFRLEPLDEWYPKVMREVVIYEEFSLLTKPVTVAPIKKDFEKRFAGLMALPLEESWWENKNERPKQHGKHAKKWAEDMLVKVEALLLLPAKVL